MGRIYRISNSLGINRDALLLWLVVDLSESYLFFVYFSCRSVSWAIVSCNRSNLYNQLFMYYDDS